MHKWMESGNGCRVSGLDVLVLIYGIPRQILPVSLLLWLHIETVYHVRHHIARQ